jgi:glycosyltransferase involved in cell wall biosynthesis
MISAIIATHESERALVPTLAALVPGATAGLLAEAIVADAGSRDATAEVADIAGCRYMRSDAPLGARLKAAAETARAPWLMFLRAGAVPQPGWVGAAEDFMASATMAGSARGAVFRPRTASDLVRPGIAEVLMVIRAAIGGRPKPEQGLLIAKRFYLDVGGHPGGENAEAGLLRRIGRRRIALLAAGIATLSAHSRA